MEDNYKKALWIPSDLNTQIKVFAAKNNMSIESASQLLLKLGVCSYEEDKETETS